MARERVALTDKEEKILIQAQLMGLNTSSMVKIGNRLKALEREREQKSNVDVLVSNFTYKQKENSMGWEITDNEGKVWHFTNRHRSSRNRGWSNQIELTYDISVEKPGTRFQVRSATRQTLYISGDWGPAKFMPEKNKELYAMMRGIYHNRFSFAKVTNK